MEFVVAGGQCFVFACFFVFWLASLSLLWKDVLGSLVGVDVELERGWWREYVEGLGGSDGLRCCCLLGICGAWLPSLL